MSFADNLTLVRKHHTFQMGVDEILRGNKIFQCQFFWVEILSSAICRAGY